MRLLVPMEGPSYEPTILNLAEVQWELVDDDGGAEAPHLPQPLPMDVEIIDFLIQSYTDGEATLYTFDSYEAYDRARSKSEGLGRLHSDVGDVLEELLISHFYDESREANVDTDACGGPLPDLGGGEQGAHPPIHPSSHPPILPTHPFSHLPHPPTHPFSQPAHPPNQPILPTCPSSQPTHSPTHSP